MLGKPIIPFQIVEFSKGDSKIRPRMTRATSQVPRIKHGQQPRFYSDYNLYPNCLCA